MKKPVSFTLGNFIHCVLCKQNIYDYTSLGMKLHLTTYKIVLCCGV